MKTFKVTVEGDITAEEIAGLIRMGCGEAIRSLKPRIQGRLDCNRFDDASQMVTMIVVRDAVCNSVTVEECK